AATRLGAGRTSLKTPGARVKRAPVSQAVLVRLYGLDRASYRGRALGPVLGLVVHLRALVQRLEALAGDRAVMNEHVLRAIVGCDEPVALVVAKPLDSSSGHVIPPLRVLRRGGCNEATTPAA